MFVLDVSISIGNDENFRTVTQFASDMSRFLDIGLNDSLLGMMLFARHSNVYFHVQEHTNENDLIAAIDSMVYSEIPEPDRTGTNIPEALDLLRTAGRSGGELRLRDDPTTAKIVIFITDGRPNTKISQEIHNKKMLRIQRMQLLDFMSLTFMIKCMLLVFKEIKISTLWSWSISFLILYWFIL